SHPTKKQAIVMTALPASNYENLQKTVVDFQSANSFDKLLTTKKFIGTALIVKNDQIILEKGYGYSNQAAHKKNTVHSHFQIGSIQKSITASLIAQLIEANKLSFQTKLAQFF
uniref:serine hydrolase n=2 Tax=Enterococcus TaxID=1350 RepID=UPI0034E93B63